MIDRKSPLDRFGVQIKGNLAVSSAIFTSQGFGGGPTCGGVQLLDLLLVRSNEEVLQLQVGRALVPIAPGNKENLQLIKVVRQRTWAMMSWGE